MLERQRIVLLNARGGVYSGEMSAMENAVTFMEKVFGGMFGNEHHRRSNHRRPQCRSF